MNSIFNRWQAYWFRPGSLLNLAICRIVIIGFQLSVLLTTNYQKHCKKISEYPDFIYDPLPVLQLFIWPFGLDYRPSYVVLIASYGITVFAGICALVGFKTRLSMVFFAVGNIFLQATSYSFGKYHHPEALMMISLAILAISPAGMKLSLDSHFLRKRQAHGTPDKLGKNKLISDINSFAFWPILLIRWLFALVYLDAAISKLEDGGLAWINGYTLQYYLFEDGLRWGSKLALWLGHQHLLVLILSCAAIIFEGTFFLILIFPKLAALYIPMGFTFHMGIYLTQKAPFFTFLALYSVFIPWTLLFARIAARKRI